jgi:hypothetical protein
MANGRMKQTIFNSKPPQVTAWISLGNWPTIWLKLLSMRLRILLWMFSTYGAKEHFDFFFLKRCWQLRLQHLHQAAGC